MKDNTLKKLQETQLEILKEIARICEANDLNYYLIGGTLLGAIRHKGFIPWDDDIDIVMPREDYNKFLNLCEEQLDKKYYVHHSGMDEEYWLPFGKVRKHNTILKEELDTNSKYNGIFVDIFPLDNAKKQNSLFQFLQAKFVKPFNPILFYRCGMDKKHFSKKTIFFSNLTKIISISRMNKIRDFVMSFNKNENSHYYVNLGSQYHYVKQTIPKDKFFPPVKVEFEKESFNAPNDSDYFLRRIYGDNYMELPPIEKRSGHHAIKVVFDTTKEESTD